MPLTDTRIRQTKPAEKIVKLTDGGGLYLEVRPNGARLWRYRYKIAGRENTFAIGTYPGVSLQDARRLRAEARELVRQGLHPSHARQAERARNVGEGAQTFQAIAEEWIAKKRPTWTPYYLRQVERFFAADVYPHIGRLPLRSVTSAHALDVLTRVTDRDAITVAINLRQWMSAVFRYAVATLRADIDPVAALKGVIVRPAVQNAEPMSREQVAAVRAALDAYRGMRTTALALRLLMLTFVRTIEMRRAAWSEIQFDAQQWVIPAGKMKMGRTHIVPLSRQAMEVVRELHTITGAGAHLFPNSRRPSDIMSGTTVNRALELIGVPFSGHDFRATASTHLYEMGWDGRLVEMQLAHAETNKVKAAYNHAQHLAERRRMMQAWADWIDAC